MNYGETPNSIPITPRERRELIWYFDKNNPWDLHEIIHDNKFMGVSLHVCVDGDARRSQIECKSSEFKKSKPSNDKLSGETPLNPP